MSESSIKKSGVYGLFGKRYGDILINVLQGCCNGIADFGNVCNVVRDCIGIDEVNGDSNLFLNQKGEFISITVGIQTQTDIFTGLTSGTTVTLTQTPITILYGDRNGLGQLEGVGFDYTISGTTVTFNTAFGSSVGGAEVETVKFVYLY